MKRRSLDRLAGIVTLFIGAASALGQGTVFTYQGWLTDNGNPANGTYDLRFGLWDSAANGNQVGADVIAAPVAVSQGLFRVALDFGLVPFNGDKRWLEMGARPNGAAGGCTTLSPRQLLAPTPYALFANRSGTADLVQWHNLLGVPVGFTDGVDNDTLYGAGLGLNLGSGNLFSVVYAGNGTSASAARSDHDHLGQSWSAAQARGLSVTTTLAAGAGVAGLLGRQGTGAGSSFNIPAGVWGDSSDGIGALGSTMLVNGAGLQGWHFPTLGSGAGVHGLSASANGRGVRGAAYSASGTNYGVYGESSSPDGFGGYFVNAYGGADTALRALADASSADDIHPLASFPSAAGEFAGRLGVIGASTGKSATSYGVVGLTPGTLGSGVYGYARATNGSAYGVQGQSDSTAGRGVYGRANANSGVNYGVYGVSDSDDGFGLYGRAGGTSGLSVTRGAGVLGESRTNYGVVGLCASNAAVLGSSESGEGVFGISDTGDGVRGTARTGRGVHGSSTTSNGVVGLSGAGVGVRAQSASGNPLEAYAGSASSPSRRFYVSNAGNVYADGSFNPGGADLAEGLPGEGNTSDYEPGDVLEISPGTDLSVRKSRAPYSPLVAGVRATQPGVLLSERGARAGADDLVPVGVIGILPTKVSGENGPIAKGDLLVSSGTPGHAMKGTDRERMFGATLGKALENFSGPGAGRIKVLVNLR